jgi:cytochrome P450
MNFFTAYKAVRDIAYDCAGFSSGHLIPFRTLPAKTFRSPPMSSDPPDHRRVRQMLTPLFKQSALDSLAPLIRDTARELLEPIRTAREVDAATAYVQPLSTAVLGRFLGVDPADGPWLRAQAAAITNPASNEGFVEANEALEFYLRQRLRKTNVGAIGYLQRHRPGGRPLGSAFLVNVLRFLVIAGADTTASALGGALHHLSLNPQEAEQLRRDRSLIEPAVEEYVRLYAPVSPGRIVTRDTRIEGVELAAGDIVLLSYAAANRDPMKFSDPDVVDLTREKNPHLGFGAGIHRCMGIHLARQTLRLALEAWLEAVPAFSPQEGPISWSAGIVRGPASLPLRLGEA